MDKIRKIRKAAMVLLAVMGLALLANLVWVIVATLEEYQNPAWGVLAPALVGSNIIRLALLLSIMGCAAWLLLSIVRDASPFNRKNVWLLRAIAVVIALFDPFEFFAQHVRGAPDFTAIYRPLGSFLMVGIAIFGVSLAFQYGIALQQLSDETL